MVAETYEPPSAPCNALLLGVGSGFVQGFGRQIVKMITQDFAGTTQEIHLLIHHEPRTREFLK